MTTRTDRRETTGGGDSSTNTKRETAAETKDGKGAREKKKQKKKKGKKRGGRTIENSRARERGTSAVLAPTARPHPAHSAAGLGRERTGGRAGIRPGPSQRLVPEIEVGRCIWQTAGCVSGTGE